MSHRPLERFPELRAIKPAATQCKARSVCRNRTAGQTRCIGNAPPGRRWCWVHELIESEGRCVDLFQESGADAS